MRSPRDRPPRCSHRDRTRARWGVTVGLIGPMMLTTGWYRCTSPDDSVTVRTLASVTVTEYHIEWNPVAPRHVGGNV